MGARADIDAAINAISGPPASFTLRLGISAAQAFMADLYHDDYLPTPPADQARSTVPLIGRYRGVVVRSSAEFAGWELVGP